MKSKGGLATSIRSLKANLGRSIGVAITGIGAPMGLSFVLQSLLGATPLQAFASGAALCSTSLGTTFTILGTSGLSATRLGVVLTSAAMMDDVVGLVMVQVISNLGDGAFDAVTVVRPVLVSIGFSVLIPVLCRTIVKPLTLKLNHAREASPGSILDKTLSNEKSGFVIHTLILFGLVVGGAYAGTSSLLAAYIAGASISWWDSEVPHASMYRYSVPCTGEHAVIPGVKDQRLTSGMEVYERHYHAAVARLLKPLFFVGIPYDTKEPLLTRHRPRSDSLSRLPRCSPEP